MYHNVIVLYQRTIHIQLYYSVDQSVVGCGALPVGVGVGAAVDAERGGNGADGDIAKEEAHCRVANRRLRRAARVVEGEVTGDNHLRRGAVDVGGVGVGVNHVHRRLCVGP